MFEGQALSPRTRALLEQFPGPVTIYWSWFWRVFLISCGTYFLIFGGVALLSLVAPSVLSAADLEPVSLSNGNNNGLNAVLACAALAFGLFSLLVAFLPKVMNLTLDREGFEFNHPLWKRRFLWADSTGFEAFSIPLGFVLFRNAVEPKGWRGVLSDWPMIGGYTLTNFFNLPAKELAALMNAWRERALSLPSGSAAS